MRIYFFFLFLFFSLTGFAQNDTVRKIITYDVVQVIDTVGKPIQVNFELMLFAGDKYGYSTSRNNYIADSIGKMYKEIALANPQNLNFSSNNVPKTLSSIEALSVLFSYKEKLFWETNKAGFNRFVMEDSEMPVWQLEQRQESINGYLCQAATADYKCRKWTAWFTTEIPVNCGPWKLNGLPGLIVKATDQSGQVQINLKEVKEPAEARKIETDFSTYTKCSRKEYARQLTAYANDPLNYMKSQTGVDFFTEPGATPRPMKLLLPRYPLDLCKPVDK